MSLFPLRSTISISIENEPGHKLDVCRDNKHVVIDVDAEMMNSQQQLCLVDVITAR